jgi:hypothetical protein
MNLRLEAFSPTQGFGIFRVDEGLTLVRPPYRSMAKVRIDEQGLGDAISKYGFHSSKVEFTSWDDAIRFLKEQVVQSHRAAGREIPDKISLKEVVKLAPPEVLAKYLAKVDADLIKQGHFDSAEDFLITFLSSDVLRQYPELGQQAADLLAKNREARTNAESQTEQLSMSELVFPSLTFYVRGLQSDFYMSNAEIPTGYCTPILISPNYSRPKIGLAHEALLGCKLIRHVIEFKTYSRANVGVQTLREMCC